MSVDFRISGSRKVRLQLGVSLILTGKLAEAESVFGDILARDSGDTDALNNLAIAYRLQGKLYDAADALLNAINIDPAKAETQYNLGKVYKQLGNFKSAAIACAKAVENDPMFIPAYINLGAAYYLLKEFGTAANFLERGLALDPANRFLKANYQAALEAKRVSEAADAPADASPSDDIPAGDSPETEVFEAGDIFTGVPIGDVASRRITALRRKKSSAAAGAEPSYTLADLTGLLRYLLELSTFLLPPARKTFEEQGIGRLIESVIGGLSRTSSGPAPVTVSKPNDAGAFFTTLTGMFGLFESLLQDSSATEQQDTLKRKMEDILEDLKQ
jgi:tetratricopeptide (TPR) repeat protein